MTGQWELRCSRCEYVFRAAAEDLAAATATAQLNGWIIDDSNLCPGCAGADWNATLRTTTDHTAIRQWAKLHGGAPATAGPHTSEGSQHLRLDFTGGASDEPLERISWGRWLAAFDAEGLAFRWHDAEVPGVDPSYFDLVPRRTA